MNKTMIEADRIDLMLTRLLPCDSKAAYERTLHLLAEELEWGAPDARGIRDGDPINRFMWGVVTKIGPVPPNDRPSRAGLAFTYVEQMIVRWATTTETSQGSRAEAEYLALILSRPVAEVEEAIRKYGPAKGRRGFGFA